ncbi:carbohydrate kinase [Oscillatoriales cyanobacterium LEGE 11467]|uniref:Carbohydrate kinase n=1 Tax=Zarconia navalis LEGE 11467 TaxID=1828826 RepID=A0A928VWY6_9CYAN|nr:carbohydrate kinase [Zarconia navalis]MBE9041084.1 carbohydrate kinase [Zarconia navalis LEGE 11467]
MTDPRVLCLGEILFDCLADRAGEPIERVESWTPYPGGAPANVACGLVKLGTSAGFVGCIGNDRPGDELVDLLLKVGVDITGVQRHPTAPTRQVYVLRSNDGDRIFAGFGDLPTDKFADTRLQAEELPEALFAEAEFLVLGTLEMAYPKTRRAIERALELADRYYTKIFLDVNWRPVFWNDRAEGERTIWQMMSRVDFVKLSQEEAQWLFSTTDAETIALRLNDVEGVLVTLGEQGCSYYLNDFAGRVDAFPVRVEDTTGAGDGFVAGLLHQLCRNGYKGLSDAATIERTVTYACAVGALTATKPGAIAAQPSARDVEAFGR